ncbi:MAG TPA: YccF domain-containing protein [Bacillota bacterium]|nr:YccF domain-containing protein [Bacillota bacterium]HOK69509.1 YccF domain-containing protein [Bacillota bacterium]HPP85588.1 YccF domain-containing protein [Bacillota bacterium]
MKTVGNILWFILCGLVLGLSWALVGVLWCITIIGIPWGVQCFKFAKLAFAPFGKNVQYGSGLFSLFLNIIWLLFSGIPLAVESFLIGCSLCVTIIGIPFGIQCFKFAKLALLPFGASVVKAA